MSKIKYNHLLIGSLFFNAILLLLIFGAILFKDSDNKKQNITYYDSKLPLEDKHDKSYLKNNKKNNTKNIKSETTADKKEDKKIEDNIILTPENLEAFVNNSTVDYFNQLSKMFPNAKTLDEHYSKIYEYLLSRYGKDEADTLFAVYKKFLKCEMDLKHERMKWGLPKNKEEWMQYIQKINNYRTDSLGKQISEKLFGNEYRNMIFKMKKEDIINDDTLYGHQKEQWLEDIAMDTWGDNYEDKMYSEFRTSYDMYKEKMKLYEKDFSEMDEEEKKEKIKEFRKQLLSDKLIKNLEEADEMTEKGYETINSYKSAETNILSDNKLTAKQKDQKIKELQDNTFGENADAFRRAEAIQKASKEAAKKLYNDQ